MNAGRQNGEPADRGLLVQAVGGDEPCPYLPHKTAHLVGGMLGPDQFLSPEMHEALLGANHRRSRFVVYRPECDGCQQCRSLRVLADRFHPTRSMRRVRRRNADVDASLGEPLPTDEKYEVYRRYLAHQHDGTMSEEYDAFRSFLYQSPTDTAEVCYRLCGRIAAVSIVDRVPGGLSSVYTYFDPRDRRRSLGTYSALWEIEYCRREGLPYYYFGYYVAGCSKMAYKARFRPNEIYDATLSSDTEVGRYVSGRWLLFRE